MYHDVMIVIKLYAKKGDQMTRTLPPHKSRITWKGGRTLPKKGKKRKIRVRKHTRGINNATANI